MYGINMGLQATVVTLLITTTLVLGLPHPETPSQTGLKINEVEILNNKLEPKMDNEMTTTMPNLDPNNEPQNFEDGISKPSNKRFINLNNIFGFRNHRSQCCHQDCHWHNHGYWSHGQWHPNWQRSCNCTHYCDHHHHDDHHHHHHHKK